MWVPIMYFCTFIVAFYACVSFLIKNKKISSKFVLIGILVCVHSLGKLTVSLSTSLEMVIWATRFMNLGSVFCPVMLIFIIASLCGQKMKKYIEYPFILFSIVTFLFTVTIGASDVYYKDLSINTSEGYTYLVKSYGPAYFVYPVLMFICLIFLIYYIVYAIKHRKIISYNSILVICTIPSIVVVIYAIELIIGSHVSYLSIGYLIGSIIIKWLFTRQQMFDMTSNLAISIDRMNEFGYIEVDTKNKFIKANGIVRELFPEIERDFHVDKVINPSDSILYTDVISWAINPNYLDKVKNLHLNDKYYHISVRDINYSGKKVGYLIEFIDRTDEYKYTEIIKNYNDNLRIEVAKKTEALRYARDRLVIGMAEMAESRDADTGSHIKRTSTAVEIFSNYMLNNNNPYNLSPSFFKMVAKAAPMHDLGKVTIDDKILRKPGRLTDEEFEEMKKHSEAGAMIIEKVLRAAGDDEFVNIAKNIAWHHHEKWNGTGYPSKLKENDIPVEARIMTLVDVFDALVSKRCYKEAFTYDQAFSIIEEGLGSQFDPILGKEFLNCRKLLEELYNNNVH